MTEMHTAVGELAWRVSQPCTTTTRPARISRARLCLVIRAFGGEVESTAERIAVTPEQVDELELPMRPEKNSLAEVVELDVIPPDVLAELVEKAIQSCIPVGHRRAFVQVRTVRRQRGALQHGRSVCDRCQVSYYEPPRIVETVSLRPVFGQPKFERLSLECDRDAPE